MANKALWWRNLAGQCEDDISRVHTAQMGLEETTLWLSAHIRRGSGDRENLEVALEIISYAASITQEYLDRLRNERKELDHVPASRNATRPIQGFASRGEGEIATTGTHS